MSIIKKYFCSSIGFKKVMGLSGLALCLFVLTHMAGNFSMFLGPDAYNKYGHSIVSMPGFLLVEAGLFGVIALHFFSGMWLTKLNRAARGGQGYAMTPNGDKEATLASRTMIASGILIGFFIIQHILTFRFGPYYETTVDGVVMRDLFKLMVEKFSDPIYMGWYVVAVFVLGFHLSHGFWSSFQSLGLCDIRFRGFFKKLSFLFGVLIALGFGAQPLYVYLVHRG
jgi:succinate dehydrogenase / fumarate reductase cytochrome b subunit